MSTHSNPTDNVAEAVTVEEIAIPVPGAALPGLLQLRPADVGVVIFAHGSGSSRYSRRNRHVAHLLGESRLGTLLFDLLTEDENQIDAIGAERRFDIPLLAQRLTAVVDWFADREPELPIGLFGASTGAAAALTTAAQRPHRIGAVVSRGGRPDLAGGVLAQVRAPTLLIVGSWDPEVVALNREAAQDLSCSHRVTVVQGASHLFEEPHKLDEVAGLASAWFLAHLAPRR